jgi:hypothetical protein
MTSKRYTPEEVWQADGGILTLGEDELRGLVSSALSKVPRSVTDKVLNGCLFVMAKYEWGRATLIPKELIRKRCVIALSEKLLDEDRQSAEYTVLHEVAHFHLKHMPSGLTAACSEDHEVRQETEADLLADHWLDSFWREQRLPQRRMTATGETCRPEEAVRSLSVRRRK